MANEEERNDQKSRSAAAAASAAKGGENETGDPGRTPGTAEGDEQTIDEDLRRKENQGQK